MIILPLLKITAVIVIITTTEINKNPPLLLSCLPAAPAFTERDRGKGRMRQGKEIPTPSPFQQIRLLLPPNPFLQ